MPMCSRHTFAGCHGHICSITMLPRSSTTTTTRMLAWATRTRQHLAQHLALTRASSTVQGTWLGAALWTV